MWISTPRIKMKTRLEPTLMQALGPWEGGALEPEGFKEGGGGGGDSGHGQLLGCYNAFVQKLKLGLNLVNCCSKILIFSTHLGC